MQKIEECFMVVSNVLGTELPRVHKFISEENIFEKAIQIHGEKRKMFKLLMHNSTRDFGLFLAHTIRKNIPSNPLLHQSFDFCKPHDCSLLFTEKNAAPQVWHMDSLNRFLVVNVLINTANSTEFLKLPYVLEDQDIHQQWDYPTVWESATSEYWKPTVSAGDAIVFWSNAIHRGPAATEPDVNTRVTLYLTFQRKSESNLITTDFAFPNWAWFDSRFLGTESPIKRCAEEIEFLTHHEHLIPLLFPRNWFGQKILKSVQQQVEVRKAQAEHFPESLNLYRVYWVNSFYLAQMTVTDQQRVKLRYFPTEDSKEETFEVLSAVEWFWIKKEKITRKNIGRLECGGWDMKRSQQIGDIVQTLLIYPFSHSILLKDNPSSWDVVFPLKLQLRENDVFTPHPDLLFKQIK